MEVKMERELFRNILFLTLQLKIDMGEMLKLPLTPIPRCQTHIDGWMQKTTRSSLVKELETRVIYEAPPMILLQLMALSSCEFLIVYANFKKGMWSK